MRTQLPGTMKTVGMEENSGKLLIRHVPIPRPGKGEVLVRISAAPVNPSDLSRIKGIADPSQRCIFIGGLEGSGIVVACGAGILPHLWNGKRVACTSTGISSGSWAEYMLTTAGSCVPLPKKVTDEQGSMMLINPLTALAFFDMARKQKAKAIINTAPSGSLGKLIIHLSKIYSVPVINIARNKKQTETLKNNGIEYVLDSSQSNFTVELTELTQRLKASLAFEAIGGRFTEKLITTLPSGSKLFIYGNLSGEPPMLNYRSLIYGNIAVSGFYLGTWLKEQSTLSVLRSIFKVRKIMKGGFSSTVSGRFRLEQVQEAIDAYLSNMTAGKVLLVP